MKGSLRPVASLIKTTQLEGDAEQLIFNELFFGFVLLPGEDDRQAVVLIEKKALFNASIPSEGTEKRQIWLQDDGSTSTVGINTTSLVYALGGRRMRKMSREALMTTKMKATTLTRILRTKRWSFLCT